MANTPVEGIEVMAPTAEQIESILAAAVEIDSDTERKAFVAQACLGDTDLKQRVEAFIVNHFQASGFLESPIANLLATYDETPITESPGAVIGPYKLLEQIGEGGFGVVFMAEQHQPMRRKVALKVLKPGMDTRQVIARFEAERQALALMDHPNIARIFDGGETTSGRPYFVMELVRGIPITDFCDQNHLSIRDRIELFTSVCQAVQHAHQKGIIHRDLKPSNVMVTMHDHVPIVKVIDFGIAKTMGQQLTEKTLFTNFAQMIGTPVYMSPEQAQMSGLDIDTRTDIYSLGVLLYELLTGTTPFDKERLGTAAYDEMRRIIREEEPAKPSARVSTLGQADVTISANRQSDPKHLRQLFRGELDWIVMKALEKDRNRRYETAGSLAADVLRYLRDEPVQACLPSAGYRFRKFVRRHKAALGVAVLAGCVLLLSGVLAVGIPLNAALREQRDTALANQNRAERAERENKTRAHLGKAAAYRRSGGLGQRFNCLMEINHALKLDPSAELRDELRTEAIAALVLPDVEIACEWDAWSEDSVVVFDAAFQQYARLNNQGSVTICRLSEGREEVVTRLPPHGKPPFGGPWMSPDGRFVAYAHTWLAAGVFAEVHLWKLDGPAPTVVSLDESTGMHEAALAFHPKGRQLAIGCADRSISIFDVATGKRVQRLAVGAAPHHLAFHPRESRLAVAAGNAVQLFDTDTWRELPALRHPAAVTRTHSVSWHPDGQRLATGCNDRKIHLWDTEAGAEVMPPWLHGDDGIQVAFSPAGDRLVSIGWDAQTWLWDTASGRLLLKMPAQFGLQFSLDGRLLGHAVRGNRLQLGRLAYGRELATLRGRGADGGPTIHRPVVHDNGRTLAAGSERGLHFFDLATGEELASVRLPQGETDCPVFFDTPRSSPDSAGGETEQSPGGWVTSGGNGLLLWPARSDPDRPEVLRVGPPQQLAPGLNSPFAREANASSDGRVVVAPDGRFTTVIHRDHAAQRLKLGPQQDLRFTAVSPDGRWVVTGSHWHYYLGSSARVWDAESGQQVHELPLVGSTFARFSPDGRWLMTRSSGTSASDSRLWQVGTWREVRRFDYGGFAFSPDSRLLAIGDVFSVIRLVETATGREVARLTGPEPTGYGPECFTPDGTRLIASSSSGALFVWDLRLIRQQLKELNLDWDWSEFSPAEPATKAVAQLKVEVLPGLTRQQKAQQAIEQYRSAVEANPNNALACNNLAWFYLTAPESLRDVEAALPLAEKAVRLAPQKPAYVNTLGVAYYRNSRYRESIEILRPNLETQADSGLVYDLFFLAMSHHRLGETERARDYYDWAVRWTKAQQGASADDVEELRAIRAEAEELLGIETAN